MKIIVADDTESIRKSVARYLKICGHEVLEAENGRQAGEKLDESISLVLTDLDMPEMEGDEFIKAARRGEFHEIGKSIPIILMTGRPLSVAKKAGADALLLKPFPLDMLENVICRFARP